MDKLQAMEAFVHVVDAGGFTRAAEILKLPKATVSTLIQALEKSLSVRLLNRTTRHVSVTAEGAVYYDKCLQILSDVRETEESLTHARLNPSGRLRVDAPTGLASEVIIPALEGFFALYPNIQLELGCSDRQVDLLEEGIDCVIRGGRQLTDSTLIARRIGTMHYATCASPGYVQRHGAPKHPRELHDHRCINYFSARSGKAFDWYFTRGGERIQLALNSHIALSDSYAYTAAGLSGLGIIQMANFLTQPMLDDGRLIAILEEWAIDPLPVYVVYPQNRHIPTRMRVFVDWISKLFSHHPTMN